MKTLYVIYGPDQSGKTTIAEKLSEIILENAKIKEIKEFIAASEQCKNISVVLSNQLDGFDFGWIKTLSKVHGYQLIEIVTGPTKFLNGRYFTPTK